MSPFPSSPGENRTLELLGRIHDGNDEAWNELYHLYHDELLFTIRMNLATGLRSALESEDVLQSVALEAFKALPRFEHRGEGSPICHGRPRLGGFFSLIGSLRERPRKPLQNLLQPFDSTSFAAWPRAASLVPA